MALENPYCSSDSIWFGENEDKSVTQEVNEKAALNHTHTDYAPVSHTHSEYAPVSHTHDYAPAVHEHDYAAPDHTHTGFAADTHTHTPASIGAAAASHEHNYAAVSHAHEQSEVNGLASALSAKADLVDGKVPESQLPSYVSDIVEGTLATFPTAGASDKIYVDTATNKSYRWSGSAYIEIGSGVAIGETASTAHRGDHGKTAYEHSQNANVHVTASEKAAWNSKAEGDHTHTGFATETHNHDSDYIAKSLQFTNNSGGVEFSFGENSGKNILTEISGWGVGFHTAYAITGTEGNPVADNSFRYLVHKTSANIGWVIAISGHGELYINYEHNGAYRGWRKVYSTLNPPTAAEVGAVSKDLQLTSDNGNVKENLSDKNVLVEIATKEAGVHTFYAVAGSTNNPKAGVSWRYFVHKTTTTYGWVLAFGSDGSVYSNYLDGGTWKGWRAIYDKSPCLLWQHPNGSGYYMNDSQTIMPNKKLSECAHGWVLVWSDYDSTTNTSANADIATTYIPKKMVNGADWSGQSMLCVVPVGMSETADNITVKRLYIHDDCITGHAHNSTGTLRIDTVLRCVYEF